jgi:hypothetical protein
MVCGASRSNKGNIDNDGEMDNNDDTEANYDHDIELDDVQENDDNAVPCSKTIMEDNNDGYDDSNEDTSNDNEQVLDSNETSRNDNGNDNSNCVVSHDANEPLLNNNGDSATSLTETNHNTDIAHMVDDPPVDNTHTANLSIPTTVPILPGWNPNTWLCHKCNAEMTARFKRCGNCKSWKHGIRTMKKILPTCSANGDDTNTPSGKKGRQQRRILSQKKALAWVLR